MSQPCLCRVFPLLAALSLLTSLHAATPFAGATALVVQPENSYNGYDFTISAALLRRGFVVTQGLPADLTDATKLAAYDLVATNLKRSFTPEQSAGLKAYVAAGGAMYGNWGGPMSCPELLAVAGLKNARSVYIRELSLPESPLTVGLGPQHWAFPEFAGHVNLGDQGREMVAFDLLDGLPVARDAEGRCLGAVREEGAGRCAVLGFCPSNYRFVTDDSQQAGRVLDNLLTWLLPHGPRPRAVRETLRACLPREARVASLTVNGRRVPQPEVQVVGSLQAVTIPLGPLAEGKRATIHVACTLPKTAHHIETWLHDPSACLLNSFTPPEAADFLAKLHVTTVQPLLRYEGGAINCGHGIAGDTLRGSLKDYPGDKFADVLAACHARGIKVIGGLYLDWRRFAVHLKDAPLYVAKGQPAPEPKLGLPVCPLDQGVWEHNLSIVQNLLDSYPGLDGLILDDNFEFDQRPCYCPACQAKFAAYCAAQPGAPDPQAEAEAGGPVWKAFWRERKLAFCKAVRDRCAARGKPVGGWTQQRGPVAFKGVFDFVGDMVYVEPPCSVAPLWSQVGDFPIVTLLWGMNRNPAGMEADLTEAVRAGSSIVGFWIQYKRQEGVTDNPWSLGWTDGSHFALTPGTLGAIERSFARVERDWRDHYRDNLIQGDPRFVVTAAKLDGKGLTLTVQRLGRPSANRVVGAVDLSGLGPEKP